MTEERPRDYCVAAIRPRILGLARAPVGEPARPGEREHNVSHEMIVRRGWFYQLIRALAIIELLWFMAVVVDLLLHPFAVTLNGDPALLRLMNTFVTAPVILAVGDGR